MATDTGFEVLIDTDDQDKRSEIVVRVLQALTQYTRTTAYSTTYAAGTTSTNQVTLQVAGVGTVNVAIRVTCDSAVVGTDEVPEIERKILQALGSETLVIAHAAAYTAGNRTYNVTVALS